MGGRGERMPEATFNILGSSIGKDALQCGAEGYEIKGCVIGVNPLFISEGEMEVLNSDKADWVVVDTQYLSCGVESDASAEITALAKYLKKNWRRKIIIICARPSAYLMGENAVYPIPDFMGSSFSDGAAAKLLDEANGYSITLPFDCISRDGKPFHYIPRILEYIRSSIDVITDKYDRNALDSLSAGCSGDIGSILSDTAAGTIALRKAYAEAVSEGNRADACSACVELIERGDVASACVMEQAYKMAVKGKVKLDTRIGWLRRLDSMGMMWAKYSLFNALWKKGTKKSNKEMIELISKPAEEGDGMSCRLLGRAYLNGKGVKADLKQAEKYLRTAVDLKVPLARNDLFDVLWKVGTPESYKEMIEIIEVPASKSEPGALARMGRAYREGKGVPADPNKALDYLKRAASRSKTFVKEFEALKKSS